MTRVPAKLRRFIRRRAGGRCEYCLIHEDDTMFPHGVDHIVAKKHHGQTDESNLAWACFLCNGYKGSDIASVDLETGRIEPLFDPRRDSWARHFRLDGAVIVPRTAKGRVTEYLLRFNIPRSVQARQALIRAGTYPSDRRTLRGH